MERFAIAALAACLLMGCSPQSPGQPDSAEVEPAEPQVNICDGQPHRFGDVELTVERCELVDGVVYVDGMVLNASEGAIIPILVSASLADNFGNQIDIDDKSILFFDLPMHPGVDNPFRIAGQTPVESASEWTATLHLRTSKRQDGTFDVETVTGTFSQALH